MAEHETTGKTVLMTGGAPPLVFSCTCATHTSCEPCPMCLDAILHGPLSIEVRPPGGGMRGRRAELGGGTA